MGTSSDYGGGVGGAWTPFKHGVSSYARHGGRDRAARVVSRWVQTQGGASGAGAASRAAVRPAQQLGALLSGVADVGLAEALRGANLSDLVGKNRLEVLQGLVDAVVGDGAELDQQAARAALCDLYDELFADAQTFEELEELRLDASGVIESLEQFLAAYIFNRLLPAIDRKLRDLDASIAANRERELRAYIRGLIDLRLEPSAALGLDWLGDEGQVLIEGVIQATYEQLDANEET